MACLETRLSGVKEVVLVEICRKLNADSKPKRYKMKKKKSDRFVILYI